MLSASGAWHGRCQTCRYEFTSYLARKVFARSYLRIVPRFRVPKTEARSIRLVGVALSRRDRAFCSTRALRATIRHLSSTSCRVSGSYARNSHRRKLRHVVAEKRCRRESRNLREAVDQFGNEDLGDARATEDGVLESYPELVRVSFVRSRSENEAQAVA
jgi:hypothetical protein